MIEADSPNLWELRRHIGEVKAKAAVVYALVWAAELVNVERNLSEAQIGECAGDLLEDYGYLKLEEVKYVLKRAVKTEKIFGRLDYNVVMGWFEAYDAERTEEAMRISDQEASEEAHALPPPAPEAMTYQEYVGATEAKARGGDKEAAAKLREIREIKEKTGRMASSGESREKETSFKQYFYRQYLPSKRNGRKTE